MNMSDIQELVRDIENAENLLERRNMAIKLSENREFRKLFMEDYFTTEAARMVQLSGDPSMDAQQRADALAMAQATGHTKRYLSMMIQMGAVAERELPDMHAALAELRSEGGE
jgi:hypothetical protein